MEGWLNNVDWILCYLKMTIQPEEEVEEEEEEENLH